MIIEPHPPLTRAWIPNERKRVSLPFYESSLSYNKPQASLIVKTCIETLLKSVPEEEFLSWCYATFYTWNTARLCETIWAFVSYPYLYFIHAQYF